MSGAAAIYNDLITHYHPSSTAILADNKGVNAAALEDLLNIFSMPT